MSKAIRIAGFIAQGTWPGSQQLPHGEDLQLVYQLAQQLLLTGGNALDRAVVLVAGDGVTQGVERIGLRDRRAGDNNVQQAAVGVDRFGRAECGLQLEGHGGGLRQRAVRLRASSRA